MIILLVVPDPTTSPKGRAVTADRWAKILTELGHDIVAVSEHNGQSGDVLVALNAIRSAKAIEAFQAARPGAPIVLALTGTDIYGYGDLFGDLERDLAVSSMDAASCLVVFQPLSAEMVPERLRDKVKVVYPSAKATAEDEEAPSGGFDVCVVGDLRPFKDPLRTALAARRLPPTSTVRVLHLGRVPSEVIAERATKEEGANRRYSWLGEVPHDEAMRLMARCKLMVISSLYEGGANVIAEAIVAGVPILASEIPGNIGILGRDYSGYFPVGDTEALATLLERAESDADFYSRLGDQCEAIRAMLDPAREARAWQGILEAL
jgi:putative glycosyltransferase (TIGR04348 family)